MDNAENRGLRKMAPCKSSIFDNIYSISKRNTIMELWNNSLYIWIKSWETFFFQIFFYIFLLTRTEMV